MGIAEDYSEQVREHLSAIPIWQPGDDLKPGTIGKFHDGVFFEEGFITDIWSDAPIATSKENGQKERYFISDKAKIVSVGAQAEVPNLPAGVLAKVDFSRKGACLFHATDLTVMQLEGLRDLLVYMNEHKDDWPRNVTVITHVESASGFALLCSQSKNWEVSLSGDASPVEALKIADASVSITSSNGAGYQSKGSGPVMMRSYGIRRRWIFPNTVEALSAKKLDLDKIDLHETIAREIDPLEL